MIIEGIVGPQAKNDGDQVKSRYDRLGAQLVSELRGRYAELATRGQLFSASNVAAQAVSVALTTTYTGLLLYNPIGNNKNLVLLGAQYALSVAPAAIASLHLIAGATQSAAALTHTTPLASPGIKSTLIGPSAPTSTAGADSAATIPTPYYLAGLCSGFTAAALPSITPGWIDLAGQIVVAPGGFVAWGALTAVTGFGSFVWAEEPV